MRSSPGQVVSNAAGAKVREVSATGKEAVADAEIERPQRKQPKTRSALPDLEQAKMAVLNTPDLRQSARNVRPRHSRVRRLVLFGAAPRLHRTVVLRYGFTSNKGG